jgi:Holliday junction resolvase
MSGAKHRRKGDRIERELVERHRALGIHAERYPLSGASHFRGSGHDLDCYVFGAEEAPLVCEVKARQNGAGFVTLEKWLGGYDALFLRRNNADPLVLIPWRLWARLVEGMRR